MEFIGCYSRIGKVEGWDVLEITLFITLKSTKQNLFFLLKWGLCRRKWIFVSLKNPLNETLKTANINVAHFLKNKKLVVGTSSRGVYVFDLDKNSHINIDRNNVLMNNSILSIGLDKENDLWLGLIMESFILRLIHQVLFFYDNTGALFSVLRS
jgi:hypothetical protein